MKALLIAAALLAPGTAWAASGDVGCVEAKLGAAAMQRIGDGVVTAAIGGTDMGQALDTDREALLAARDACRTANNWSPAALAAATNHAQAAAARLGAEAALRRDGLDPVPLAAMFAKLPEADRRSFIDAPTPVAARIIDAVSKDPAVRLRATIFFAALSGLELYTKEFAGA